MISNRIAQEQNSHPTVLIPVMASSTGNVRRQSVHVTAMRPLPFLTQTAALSGLPMRGRAGGGCLPQQIDDLAKRVSGLYWPLAKKASVSTLSGIARFEPTTSTCDSE